MEWNMARCWLFIAFDFVTENKWKKVKRPGFLFVFILQSVPSEASKNFLAMTSLLFLQDGMPLLKQDVELYK